MIKETEENKTERNTTINEIPDRNILTTTGPGETMKRTCVKTNINLERTTKTPQNTSDENPNKYIKSTLEEKS